MQRSVNVATRNQLLVTGFLKTERLTISGQVSF